MVGSTEHFNHFLKRLSDNLPPIVSLDNTRRAKVSHPFIQKCLMYSRCCNIWIYWDCWSSMVRPHLIGALTPGCLSTPTQEVPREFRPLELFGVTPCDCWQMVNYSTYSLTRFDGLLEGVVTGVYKSSLSCHWLSTLAFVAVVIR